LLLLMGFSGQSMAGINIGVNIPLPPIFAFPAPPELVVIPGTYAYFPPDVDFDIFFYGGYWYRPYDGYWYRSIGYDGPWVYIGSPPPVLLRLPPYYRIITRGERRIPYGELHRHWRAWRRERYWERHHWGRRIHERHYGFAPSFREREHRGYRGGFHRSDGFHREGTLHREGRFHRGGPFHGGGRHGDHERR
jgi:hypothetical protein